MKNAERSSGEPSASSDRVVSLPAPIEVASSALHRLHVDSLTAARWVHEGVGFGLIITHDLPTENAAIASEAASDDGAPAALPPSSRPSAFHLGRLGRPWLGARSRSSSARRRRGQTPRIGSPPSIRASTQCPHRIGPVYRSREDLGSHYPASGAISVDLLRPGISVFGCLTFHPSSRSEVMVHSEDPHSPSQRLRSWRHLADPTNPKP